MLHNSHYRLLKGSRGCSGWDGDIRVMRLVVRNEGEGDCDDWYGVTAVLIAMSSIPASILGAQNLRETRELV